MDPWLCNTFAYTRAVQCIYAPCPWTETTRRRYNYTTQYNSSASLVRQRHEVTSGRTRGPCGSEGARSACNLSAYMWPAASRRINFQDDSWVACSSMTLGLPTCRAMSRVASASRVSFHCVLPTYHAERVHQSEPNKQVLLPLNLQGKREVGPGRRGRAFIKKGASPFKAMDQRRMVISQSHTV